MEPLSPQPTMTAVPPGPGDAQRHGAPLPAGPWMAVHAQDVELLNERLAPGRNCTALAVWVGLLALANRARSCEFTASLPQVARVAGVSLATVKRAVVDLVAVGLLQRETCRVPGAREYAPSRYRVPERCRPAPERSAHRELTSAHREPRSAQRDADRLSQSITKEPDNMTRTELESLPPAAGAAAPKGGGAQAELIQVAPLPAMPTRKRFTPPTVAEVAGYAKEAGLQLDATRFADYYASRGWKVGTVPMKDWRAAARNWARRDAEQRNGTSTPDRRGLALGQILDSRKRDYSLTPEQQEEARGMPF